MECFLFVLQYINMVDVFFTGISVLLVMTAIFYLVFFGFVYYWHLKKTSLVFVPVWVAFILLWKGFIAVVVTALLFRYLPDFIHFLNI